MPKHQPPTKGASEAWLERKRGKRLCPDCGAEVGKSGSGQRKLFCDAKCRNRFHARNKARGQVLTPLVLTWRAGRGSSGSAKSAFKELCSVCDRFAAEDREAGRPPMAKYFDNLMDTGQHMDRRRDGAGCKGYQKYDTAEEAAAEAEEQTSQGRRRFESYKCRICDGHHVRRIRGPKKKAPA